MFYLRHYRTGIAVYEALDIMDCYVSGERKLIMLIDVSNYSFEALEVRRISWVQFKMNPEIRKKRSGLHFVFSE